MSMDAETLEPELRSYGISVEHVSVDDDVIDLEYMTAFPADRIHDGEIGRACNTLIDMIEADECEPMRIDATVVRSPGDVLGGWHAEAEWFEQLTTYEISETEFSKRVLETVRHEGEEAGEAGEAKAEETETEEAEAEEAAASDDESDDSGEP